MYLPKLNNKIYKNFCPEIIRNTEDNVYVMMWIMVCSIKGHCDLNQHLLKTGVCDVILHYKTTMNLGQKRDQGR